MDPLKAGTNGSGQRRSTVAELEECLNNSFMANTTCFRLPKVKVAVGRVSYAVQFEKSGTASIEEAEDAYAKAAKAISDVLQLPEVQQNEESRHWLKLFELHVNKHLHEIVLLADNNKNKPPAHYDRLEEENAQLREDIGNLKQQIEEMKAELDIYKNTSPRGPVPPLPISSSDNFLRKSQNNSPREPLPSPVDRYVNIEGEEDLELEKLVRKMEKASNLVQDLKTHDLRIRNTVEGFKQILLSVTDSKPPPRIPSHHSQIVI